MSSTPHTTNPEMSQADERGYINVRAVIITTVLLFASLLAGMGLMLIYFNILESRAAKMTVPPTAMADANAVPPKPRLQFIQMRDVPKVTEHEDLLTMRAHEDSVLAEYGWVDKANGLARIPVDSALEMIARRGSLPSMRMSINAQTTDTALIASPTPQPAAAAQPATAQPAAAQDSAKGHK